MYFSGQYKNGNKYYGTEYSYYINSPIFEGEFKNNKKYKGKLYQYEKLIFEGEFKDEERWNGKGYNNISQYFYVNGKIEGNVVVYDYINHELFEGEYKNGEKYNGILKIYFDDISYILKREVEIKEGEINGYGREYYGNHRLKYKGMYKKGKPEGKDVLYYQFFGYINYEGEFKNGMKHGFGCEYDKCGNIIYKGKFFEDKYIGN